MGPREHDRAKQGETGSEDRGWDIYPAGFRTPSAGIGRRAVALVTSCALILSACSSATERAAERAAQAPTLASMQEKGGFPAGTPGIRNLVVDFTVQDRKKIVLSEDGTGFLVVKSDRMEDPVKLVFRDDTPVTYQLPFDRLELVAIGSSMICAENAFEVSANDETELAIGIEVRAFGSEVDGKQHHIGRIEPSGPSAETHVQYSRPTLCRNVAAWEKLEYDDRPEIEDVAAIAVGVTLGVGVLALCVATMGAGCAAAGALSKF